MSVWFATIFPACSLTISCKATFPNVTYWSMFNASHLTLPFPAREYVVVAEYK